LAVKRKTGKIIYQNIMNLQTLLGEIPHIGPSHQQTLYRLGLKTVSDLLFYFPNRYQDFSHITPVAKVIAGQIVCLKGKIIDIKSNRTFYRRLTITEALLQDKSGAIRVIWFNQPFLSEQLNQAEVCLMGKITRKDGSLCLNSPSHELVKGKKKTDWIHGGRIVPVYPETKGLNSRWLRSIIYPLLRKIEGEIIDPLPAEIREKYHLPSLKEVVREIHFPSSLTKATLAKDRFAFEELFLIQLLALQNKQKNQKNPSFAIPIDLDLVKGFIETLPFQLTNSQRKVTWRILRDMESSQPMSRLLEGDVSSGKTIVATIAALNAIRAGFQVALMAPTSVLAQQHFQTISRLLKEFKISLALLTGETQKIKGRKSSATQILKQLKEGKIDLLIGTHSLIQDRVNFKKLALVVIDEQHRFGVNQRTKLRKQQAKIIPHFLSMTATPIPRTLALTLYGDLDLSLLKEKPKNLREIETKIVNPRHRINAYKFIEKQIAEGRQAFVVCPRIESENGAEEIKTVKKEFAKLTKEIFPDLKVKMLHGQMKAEEKEKVIKAFREGKIDILISTSVVEVGIDIPNASVMMIEGAERFGLAQLHQLRGRVGRSQYQSYCFLFAESSSQNTRQRLAALVHSQDGFELAEKDLQIRGPGSIYGHTQWGIPDLAMANLKNLALVEKTREAAQELLKRYPDLEPFPKLRERVKNFHSKIHLE
jgi:ATP-dependent DNA helicase RecG